MMNWILNNGKTLKLNFKDQNGSSPLLKSTSLCSPKMIYNFMKTEGVDFKAIDSFHRNIFHLLATDQRVDVFEYLTTIEDESITSILNSKEDISNSKFIFIFNISSFSSSSFRSLDTFTYCNS